MVETPKLEQKLPKVRSEQARAFLRLLRNPGLVTGAVLILITLLVALLAPFISRDPLLQDLAVRVQAPSSAHILGTDQLGRDVWARVAHGARISLWVGFAVTALSLSVGTFIGLMAGSFGKGVDNALMRVTDIFLAFPSLILAMAIAAALGSSVGNTILAVAVVSWPSYARLVRAQVLALREREFVEAATALGSSRFRIALLHLLPNVLTPILIQASFDIGQAILIAAGLSFIGVGVQPPTPEWGAMVSETRNFISSAPWASSAPALAILFTVLGFNLLGDGLRDVLDPRARK
jgi:peptide/nickel transport system permease protein